jgi:uncharacterized membrane protein YhaH (DUF805 family)
MDRFAGRATRVNFLAANLLAWALLAPLLLLWPLIERGIFSGPVETAGALLLALPALWISLAVAVRRLHDIGWSGWWWLLSLLPAVGAAQGLFLLFWPGVRGANRFGDDPREP